MAYIGSDEVRARVCDALEPQLRICKAIPQFKGRLSNRGKLAALDKKTARRVGQRIYGVLIRIDEKQREKLWSIVVEQEDRQAAAPIVWNEWLPGEVIPVMERERAFMEQWMLDTMQHPRRWQWVVKEMAVAVGFFEEVQEEWE